MSEDIPVGATVRSIVSGRIGKVLPSPRRYMRGKLIVLFDGMDRSVSIKKTAVSCVSKNYETPKIWEVNNA